MTRALRARALATHAPLQQADSTHEVVEGARKAHNSAHSREGHMAQALLRAEARSRGVRIAADHVVAACTIVAHRSDEKTF